MDEIRILFLEDRESDYLLCLKELKKSDLRFSSLRVETTQKFNQALLEFIPDIVLFDFELSSVDRFTALQTIRNLPIPIPVIMIVDAADEPAAMDAVKSGAFDFIPRERPGRLGAAVLSAIKQKHLSEERRRMNEALVHSYNDLDKQVKSRTEELAALIDNSPTITARLDKDCCFLFINSAGERATGISKDKIIGRRLRDTGAFFPDKARYLETRILNAFTSGFEETIEYDAPGEQGKKYFRANLVPERDERGNVVTVLLISNEITDLKKAEETLLKKNHELDNTRLRLEEQDKLKTEFVSIASHELRTPLTSIVAFAQTLRSPQIELTPQERDHYLSIIENEGKRLGRLLTDLLDISKIESGNFELRTSIVDILKVIKDTISAMRIPENVHLHLSLPQNPEIVQADADRIRQVFTNLLDNAVKYGNGEIELSLEQSDGLVKAGVHDNGPGIAKEDAQKIFEKFYRARTKKKGKGTGLGLAVSKGIIEAHGGKIWVESELGKGSSFYLQLPLKS